MADRVYPSAKPNTAETTNAAADTPTINVNTTFPATKPLLYNHARPTYRPQPHRSSRPSCCCKCCLWTTLTLILIILVAAITGCIVWVLYRPHGPSFSVSSVQISSSNINLTLIARNPNKKITFLYDPFSVSIKSNGVNVGDGQFPGFLQAKKTSTTMKSLVSTTSMKSIGKSKNSLMLKIQLDSKVKVKIGGSKSKKVRVRVMCDGIEATVPTGKTPTVATISKANKCKVDLRLKMWKLTF